MDLRWQIPSHGFAAAQRATTALFLSHDCYVALDHVAQAFIGQLRGREIIRNHPSGNDPKDYANLILLWIASNDFGRYEKRTSSYISFCFLHFGYILKFTILEIPAPPRVSKGFSNSCTREEASCVLNLLPIPIWYCRYTPFFCALPSFISNMVYLISCNAVIYLEGYLKHEMQRTRSSCSKESFEHFDLLVLRDLFQQHATCRLLNHGQVMVREFAGSTRDCWTIWIQIWNCWKPKTGMV